MPESCATSLVKRRTLGRRGIGIAFAELMIFATYWSLAFAILFFSIFWLCRRPTLRLGLILVVSAIFHTHYAGPAGVMPIVAMGVIVYIIGLSDNRAANAVGIILCVLMLVGYRVPGIY